MTHPQLATPACERRRRLGSSRLLTGSRKASQSRPALGPESSTTVHLYLLGLREAGEQVSPAKHGAVDNLNKVPSRYCMQHIRRISDAKF